MSGFHVELKRNSCVGLMVTPIGDRPEALKLNIICRVLVN